MELVAEAASFSAREAVKARQLARSIEDQEQCAAGARCPPANLFFCIFVMDNFARFFFALDSLTRTRYTRVREWVAEERQAEEARVKARRLAAAALKQEAHRSAPLSPCTINVARCNKWRNMIIVQCLS
jgi:hypothetical protein